MPIDAHWFAYFLMVESNNFDDILAAVGSLWIRLREGQHARHVSISQRAAMCILLAISSTDLLEVPTIFGRCFKAM